jgi:hypothetical protein
MRHATSLFPCYQNTIFVVVETRVKSVSNLTEISIRKTIEIGLPRRVHISTMKTLTWEARRAAVERLTKSISKVKGEGDRTRQSQITRKGGF